MPSSLIVPIVLLVILLIGGIIFLVTIKKQEKGSSINKKSTSTSGKNVEGYKAKGENVPKEDVFKFMEFDKILDDMIVQNKGTKFTMVVKCKGINYDLMSEVEQLAVEEGFITFLNTLKYPIQLYVQVQNIDLKKNVKLYNERISSIKDQFDEVNEEYNYTVNSLDSTDEDIVIAEYNKKSIQNVLEYANDITKYVEKLSLNKNLLQRSFYVLVSYYSSEITSAENFNKEEILDICYNELYTRAYSITSALATCSVSGAVLNSNELAELLYVSYNRDDKNYLNVKEALESGYYRLYSTSTDAFEKKNAMLEEQIEKDAKIKAYEAIKKALEEGSILTEEQAKDELNQEISQEAIKVIKEQRIDDKIKENAKKIVIEEYKENKKKLVEQTRKEQQKAEELKKHEDVPIVDEKKSNNNDSTEEENNVTSDQSTTNESKNDDKKTDSSDDLIV